LTAPPIAMEVLPVWRISVPELVVMLLHDMVPVPCVWKVFELTPLTDEVHGPATVNRLLKEVTILAFCTVSPVIPLTPAALKMCRVVVEDCTVRVPAPLTALAVVVNPAFATVSEVPLGIDIPPAHVNLPVLTQK